MILMITAVLAGYWRARYTVLKVALGSLLARWVIFEAKIWVICTKHVLINLRESVRKTNTNYAKSLRLELSHVVSHVFVLWCMIKQTDLYKNGILLRYADIVWLWLHVHGDFSVFFWFDKCANCEIRIKSLLVWVEVLKKCESLSWACFI